MSKGVGINGYSYTYRDHSILIEAGMMGLSGTIWFNPRPGVDEYVDSGFCGYELQESIERINRRIDNDIEVTR